MSTHELSDLGINALDQASVDDEFAGFIDYFGFDEYETFQLANGQWLKFKKLNEGERQRYESKTQRDVSFNRRTDDAKIKIDAASDRSALIMISVVDWRMARRDNGKFHWVTFSKGSPGSELEKWLATTNPKVINDLYVAIRKANPFLVEELTAEMIREEITRLTEMLPDAEKREREGKDS